MGDRGTASRALRRVIPALALATLAAGSLLDRGRAGPPIAGGSPAPAASRAPREALALTTAEESRADLGPEERRQVEVFRAASPSVVNITTVALRRDLLTLDVFRTSSRSRRGRAPGSSGTAAATW